MKPLSLSSPHLIIMVGIPGSGKTFFAEHFASTFNAPIVSFARISSELYGNRHLTSEEQAIVIRISHYLLEQLLKTGQTIVYEGITDTRTTRQALAKIANKQTYEPLLVWVQTESLAAKSRAIKQRRDTVSITPDEFDTIVKRFTPPNVSERAVVISGKHTYASQLKIVLKRLAEGRVEKAETPSARTAVGRHIVVR